MEADDSNVPGSASEGSILQETLQNPQEQDNTNIVIPEISLNNKNRLDALLVRITQLTNIFNQANKYQMRGLEVQKCILRDLYLEGKRLRILSMQTKRLQLVKRAIRFISNLQVCRIELIQKVDSADNKLREARESHRIHKERAQQLREKRSGKCSEQETRMRRKADVETGLNEDQIFMLRRVRAKESFRDQKKILNAPTAAFTTLIEGASTDVASFTRQKISGEPGDTENTTETSQLDSASKIGASEFSVMKGDGKSKPTTENGSEVVENNSASEILDVKNDSNTENVVKKPLMSAFNTIDQGMTQTGRG